MSALPSSGTIKMSDINTFFGASNGTSLGSYAGKGGSYLSFYNPFSSSIPASGPIYMSNFYSAQKNYFLTNGSAVTVLGAYNIAPWYSTAPNGDTTASYIWSTANANSSAPAGMWIHFFKIFNAPVAFTGTLYYNCDNYAYIMLNGKPISTSPAAGGSPNWQTVYSISITVPAGANMLDIYAQNASTADNPAGLVASLYNGSTLVTNTDSTWKYYTSSINVNTAMVIFSCRIMNPFYTGPLWNIRRSSDGVTADFYTDVAQSFVGTTSTGGTSLTAWLNGATGYVTKWYDQSSNANHAINTSNNATQPNMAIQNGKWVLQFQNGNGTLLTMGTSVQSNTIVCHYWNNNNSYASILCTQTYLEQRFNGSNGITIRGDSNDADWYYMGTVNGGTCLAYNNGVSSSTVLLSGWNYLCLSVQTPTWSYNGTTSYFNRIGYDSYSTVRSMNGYMAEMICHNTTINATDIANLYNGRLF